MLSLSVISSHSCVSSFTSPQTVAPGMRRGPTVPPFSTSSPPAVFNARGNDRDEDEYDEYDPSEEIVGEKM